MSSASATTQRGGCPSSTSDSSSATARTVLHVGDADPAADNFALLATLPRVDVALLPYWYVLTDNSRRFVAASIAPRRIVAMHMPVAERGALTQALAGTELKVAAPVTSGQLVTFPR